MQQLGPTPEVPESVQALIRAWRSAGSPKQAPIAWPRERWLGAFERHRELFSRLPDELDRATIRRMCARATESTEAAEAAFMVAMAWGYGGVGYGPWRITRILTQNRGAAARLHAAAVTLTSSGPESAYRRMTDYADCRLRFLGPAFGTKFLAFCSADSRQPALILDRLVASWLARNTRLQLNPIPWDPTAYSRYLRTMCGWADALGIEPDDLECRVFSAEANAVANQWAQTRT